MICRLRAPVLVAVTLSVLLAASVAWSFEILTHRDMSEAAFDQSSLGSVLSELVDPRHFCCSSGAPEKWKRMCKRRASDLDSISTSALDPWARPV